MPPFLQKSLLMTAILLPTLVCLLIYAIVTGHIPLWVGLAYAAMSVITLAVYAWDKRVAVKNGDSSDKPAANDAPPAKKPRLFRNNSLASNPPFETFACSFLLQLKLRNSFLACRSRIAERQLYLVPRTQVSPTPGSRTTTCSDTTYIALVARARLQLRWQRRKEKHPQFHC